MRTGGQSIILVQLSECRWRFWRVPLWRFGGGWFSEMCGRLGCVSWLRILELGGWIVEAMAEVKRRWVKRQAGGGGPQVELIA